MEISSSARKKAKQKKWSAHQASSHAEEAHTLAEPQILLEPQNKALAAGKKVSLRVRCTGTPSPEYQWLHNGVVLENSNSPVIVIPSLAEENCGVYSCDVKNFAGISYSAKALVKIWNEPLPALEISFEEEENIFAGEEKSLTVSLKNFPEELVGALSIHWYCNGKLIKKTYNSSIEIPASQEGKYSATVATGNGRVRAQAAVWGKEPVVAHSSESFSALQFDQTETHALPMESLQKSNDTSPGINEKKKEFFEKFLSAWTQHAGTHKSAAKEKKSSAKTKKKKFLEKALANFSEKSAKKHPRKNAA